ncbi:E3 ubiquitin-protein ligase RING2-like protein [Euroglyphus maynei]|uniref:E3 ubiquitin-protein ligase CHFR n=1 Tax=Euroglyphus maynei TaxID=6958 RepID=A0A1Y3B863_EURMA|nr:E3 ubiquitin-protein ligase RING2-like protein [Euroglyphus maynei]
MNNNLRNNLQINLNTPSHIIHRHHHNPSNVNNGSEQQFSEQQNQDNYELLQQLELQEKKEVPIAAGLIRIITKPEHNCFNEMILTKSQLTIGRDNQSDFQITSIEISRRHARIVHKDSSWYMINLNSTNGVYINGQKVSRPMRLLDNCFVTFGPLANSTFRYVFVENYELFMLMKKTMGKTAAHIQRSFIVGGNDITHDSTQPRKDDNSTNVNTVDPGIDINRVQQSVASFKTQIKNCESEMNKLRMEAKNKKQELDLIMTKIDMVNKEFVRKSESIKGPDALKNVIFNEMSCSICYDVMHEPTVLNCEHTFCFSCIDAWNRHGKQHCPICRKKFSRTTKSIQFQSLIKLILDHYLNEEELKERKQSIESRLTDPAFTSYEMSNGSNTYDEINEILQGLDLTLRDTLFNFLNFADSERQPNLGEILIESDDDDDDDVSFFDEGDQDVNDELFDEEEEDEQPSSNVNRNLYFVVNEDNNEHDESLDEVDRPNVVSSQIANFSDRFRLRRFINLMSSTNESMAFRDESNAANLNLDAIFSSDDENENSEHLEDDDLMDIDQSVIILDDDEDDNQHLIQTQMRNEMNRRRRTLVGNGSNIRTRNRRPTGIGQYASQWNVRPMRNRLTTINIHQTNSLQPRLRRTRNPPYSNRNGRSNESMA